MKRKQRFNSSEERLKTFNSNGVTVLNLKNEKIENLKQQLADKEKEITKLKNDNHTLISENAYLEADVFELNCLKNQATQAKTDFAIERLEKVKELCKKKFDWWENSEWEGDIYDKSDVSNAYFDIEANIDEQINELKERK